MVLIRYANDLRKYVQSPLSGLYGIRHSTDFRNESILLGLHKIILLLQIHEMVKITTQSR